MQNCRRMGKASTQEMELELELERGHESGCCAVAVELQCRKAPGQCKDDCGEPHEEDRDVSNEQMLVLMTA